MLVFEYESKKRPVRFPPLGGCREGLRILPLPPPSPRKESHYPPHMNSTFQYQIY